MQEMWHVTHHYVKFIKNQISHLLINRLGGVMINLLASRAVDRGFEPRSGQTKDFKIGICCFSAKHAALRRKSKDWVVRVGWHVYTRTVVSLG